MNLLISFSFATIVNIQGADWCYQSQVTCGGNCTGPDGWATVAGTCDGRAQSPINIVTRRTLPDGRLTPFTFTGYQEAFHGFITNNGHTVQVDLPATAKVQGGDLAVPYKAVQLHLHWGKDGGPGSEHTIDGERYPMELHIVNIKEEYNSLAEALKDTAGVGVLGFFYEESRSSNKKYDAIVNALNTIKHPIPSEIDSGRVGCGWAGLWRTHCSRPSPLPSPYRSFSDETRLTINWIPRKWGKMLLSK
ncbi:carbonic anhydrase 4b isoform X2 [Oncorhynchus nerka]|uniref:carbonic anhydrase 4b isoform X2 n=1 Tax=Oncorhynchus nerka TaxID=8023 RepID=UPI0031B873C9